VPYRRINNAQQLHRVIEALLLVEADLSLPELLRHLVEVACDLSRARYGALGVIDPRGRGLEEFITTGLDAAAEDAIGARPTGRGVLGLLISEPNPVRLDDLRTHPGRYGFPPNHPEMTSFLGMPVRVRDQVFGILYLTDKLDAPDFTDDDEAMIAALSVAAGLAIEKARLYGRIRELTLVEDRDRIARDLHDTVIQRLFAIGLSIQSVARLVDQPDVTARLATAIEDIDDTIRQIRTSIFELETAPNDIGLRRRLIDLVKELEPVIGAETEVVFAGPIDVAISAELADHLAAVAREALTNVGKHADATWVRLRLTVDTDVLLEVTDNGAGLPTTPAAGSPGRGLKNLRQRAEHYGGACELQSLGTGGSRLTWRVPL